MRQLRIILIAFLVSYFCFAQTENEIEEDFHNSLLFRVFENVTYESDVFEKYPILKKAELNSIIGCIYLLNLRNPEISNVATMRLKGIATQLFMEGKPIILTSGMNSFNSAKKLNENLEDDHNIIYLPIGDCVISEAEDKAEKTINSQTIKLIKK